MPKTKIAEYSQTPIGNEDVGNIGITGEAPVSNIDDALQTIMAHLADMNAGTAPLDDTFTLSSTVVGQGNVRFDASQVGNSTTQVLTVPNASGIILTDTTLLDENGKIAADVTGNAATADDAGLLNGQIGSFYQNADNINAGTISAERLPATISSNTTGNANTADDASNLNSQNAAFYQNASNLNAGIIPVERLPDVISVSAQAGLDEKTAKSGDIMTGALSAPQIISTAIKTDDITGNIYGVIKDQNQYWGIRQSASDDFCVDVHNNGVPLNALKITQDGYVLKPNQPSFEARTFASRTGAGRLIFDDIEHNTGNHYDQLSGVFTVPVAGKYLVTLFSGYKATSGHIGLGILLNGTTRYLGWTYNQSYAHDPISVMGVMELAADDHVSAYAHPSNTTPSAIDYYCCFSMALLG